MTLGDDNVGTPKYLFQIFIKEGSTLGEFVRGILLMVLNSD